VADAVAHGKFIAYTAEADSLFLTADPSVDEGMFALSGAADVDAFLIACRNLRFWDRLS
jgi:catalase